NCALGRVFALSLVLGNRNQLPVETCAERHSNRSAWFRDGYAVSKGTKDCGRRGESQGGMGMGDECRRQRVWLRRRYGNCCSFWVGCYLNVGRICVCHGHAL